MGDTVGGCGAVNSGGGDGGGRRVSTYSFFTGSGESDSPFRARDRGVKRRNAKGTSRVRPVVDGAMLGERLARGGRVGRRHFSPSQTARGFLEEAARGAESADATARGSERSPSRESRSPSRAASTRSGRRARILASHRARRRSVSVYSRTSRRSGGRRSSGRIRGVTLARAPRCRATCCPRRRSRRRRGAEC